MDVKQPTLQEKITRLRMSFLSQMPARLDNAQQQYQLLLSDWQGQAKLTVELHRFFHSIKGTASSFNFTALADIADTGESLMLALVELPETDDPGKTLSSVGPLFSEMKQQLQVLQKNSAESADLDQYAPFYEMDQVQSGRAEGNRKALIYICDDEPEQVSQLGYQLQCFGYEIEYFTATQSFHDAVLKRRPDG